VSGKHLEEQGFESAEQFYLSGKLCAELRLADERGLSLLVFS
jgi:hypothetical protein